MTTRKKPTPKQKVRRKHPTAISWQSPSGKWWISYPDWAGPDIGTGGATPVKAWRAAWKEEEKRSRK